jgi:hypothetical protein
VTARPMLFALLLAAFAPGWAAAQEVELALTLDRIAGHWEHADASRLAAFFAPGGVALDLDDGELGPLPPRQVAAVLRKLLGGRETTALMIRSARVVGGEPPRAFGELAWLFRARGTTIPERTTIFLALVWEEGGWRITQIRLLP